MSKNGPINEMIGADKVNFDLLHNDVKGYCKEHNMSLSQFSATKLYRSGSYYSSRISEKSIQINTLMGICDVIGQPMKKYEIAPKPVVEEKLEPIKQVAERVPENIDNTPNKEWECKVSIQPDFNIVCFALYHNGEQFTTGYAKMRGTSDVEIAKAISYAAHVCYKNVEQKDFVNRCAIGDPDSLEREPFMRNTPFKEYIKGFTGERGNRGELARFVSMHYATFPSYGEKNMRAFMLQARASKQVVDAYDAEFPKYRKWAAI